MDTHEVLCKARNQLDRDKGEVLAAFDKAIAATAPPPADPLRGVALAAESPDPERVSV